MVHSSQPRRLTELVDQHIGRILNALNKAGLEDQTLIVVTSDHGNMDASHRLSSKGLFYEESVRVPFLMKYIKVLVATATLLQRQEKLLMKDLD